MQLKKLLSSVEKLSLLLIQMALSMILKALILRKLEYIMELKNVKTGRIKEYAEKYGVEYFEGKRPWIIKCDIALPNATQNEINEDEAKMLVKNGCICVSEGANMPSTPEAVEVFLKAKILYGPGKQPMQVVWQHPDLK